MRRRWALPREAEGAEERAAAEKVEEEAEGSAGSTDRSSRRSMGAAAMPRCILATSQPEMGTTHAQHSYIIYHHGPLHQDKALAWIYRLKFLLV